MKFYQEEMLTKTHAWLKETKYCQIATEMATRIEIGQNPREVEINSSLEEVKAIDLVLNPEVIEATVGTIGASEDQLED